MKLVALLIPQEQAKYVLPRIEDLIRGSINSIGAGATVRQHFFVSAHPYSSAISGGVEQKHGREVEVYLNCGVPGAGQLITG